MLVSKASSKKRTEVLAYDFPRLSAFLTVWWCPSL
jgi:hypothetical protein